MRKNSMLAGSRVVGVMGSDMCDVVYFLVGFRECAVLDNSFSGRVIYFEFVKVDISVG